jgi:phage terminase small subunit
MKLTPKQAMFVAEYLVDSNATRAAIKAGFSEASAAVTGARLLKNAKISAAIADRKAYLVKKLELSAEHVLQELAKLAFYDIRDLFDTKGKLKPITQLDDVSRAAIAGIDVQGKRSITKIKLSDRGQNLERLGRYFKLFTDRLEHDGKLAVDDALTDHERALKISAILNAAKSRKNAA